MFGLKITFIFLIITLSLHAGILETAYKKGMNNNIDVKIAGSAVAYQNAAYKNVETLDNIYVQLDGYARYYIAQKSGLKDANFGLPDKTVVDDFVKANLNFTISKDLYNKSIDSQQTLGSKAVQKAKDFFQQNKQDLVYDITILYIEILKAYDALELSKANLEVINNEYDKSKTDVSIGTIDSVELDVISSKRACIDSLSLISLDRLNNALSHFKMITHYDLQKINTLRENIDYQTIEIQKFDTYHNDMLKKNPKLKQMQTAIEIAKEQVNLVGSRYDPSLRAQIGYEYTQNYTPIYLGRTYESGAYVGLSAVIPLYTGGRNDTAKQKASQNIQCEILKKLKVEQDMRFSLQQEYRNLLTNRIQIEASRSRVASLKNLYEQAKIKMQVGQMEGTELSKIYYKYLKSETEKREYEYSYFLAKNNLEHISGVNNLENLLIIDNMLTNDAVNIENLKKEL